MKSRPYTVAVASLALSFLMPSGGAADTTTASYTGSLVGHEAEYFGNPDAIHNTSGAIINHPYGFAFGGYYTLLTGVDAFDFDLGEELALGSNPINSTSYTNVDAPDPSRFSGTFAAGHGLAAGGITATDDNPVHIAAAGFLLDLNDADDFYFDTATLQDHRIHRGGSIALFEESPAGTYSKVYQADNLQAEIVIDWPEVIDGDSEVDVVTTISGFPKLGSDPIYPDFAIDSWTIESRTPVQVDGVNFGGAFAIYESVAEVTFSSRPPESTTFAEWRESLDLPTGSVDFDGDGLEDALEYLLGSDPVESDQSDTPTLAAVASANACALSFTIPFPANDDVQYIVETSPDFFNWVPVATKLGSADWSGTATIETQITPEGDQSVEVTTAANDDQRCFIRLRGVVAE